MKVSITWPQGQFLTTVNATVREDMLEELGARALKHEAQRCSDIDRVLGGFETVNGKSKRRADYTRGRVEYTETLAELVAVALLKHLTTQKEPKEGEEVEPLLFDDVDIPLPTRYEGAAGKEPAFAKEKKAVRDYLGAGGGLLKNGQPRTVDSFSNSPIRDNIAAPADAAAWETDTVFLAAVKEYLRKEDEKKAAAE